MADFSHLDKASIQSFIDGDLATFIQDLKTIFEGDLSMRDLMDGVTTEDTIGAVSPGKPLMMGRMDADDLTNGSSFADALSTNMDTTVNILTAQQDTFGDIDESLRTTLTELFKAQGDNLGSIEADKFTEIVSDTGFSGDASGDDSGGQSDGDGDGGDGGDDGGGDDDE